MSYRLKVVQTKQYPAIGIKGFKEAQDEAITNAVVLREDVMIINEDTDDILAVAVYHQADDVRLELSTSGLCDSPWI
jgi:hypothetical protein